MCVCERLLERTRRGLFVRTYGQVVYFTNPRTLSEVLTPFILEEKGGNHVRGYPSILPRLLCLSCSLCFLNTIHAGQAALGRNQL